MRLSSILLILAKGAGGEHVPDTLSNRELQVLRRLPLGNTNHEVAEVYGINPKTVDTYRQRLLKKLSLRNNAELFRFAMRNNLID